MENKEKEDVKKNGDSKNLIIGILIGIIIALLCVVGYFTIDKYFLPMDKVESGEVKDEAKVDEEQKEIVLTEIMKSNIKKILLISDTNGISMCSPLINSDYNGKNLSDYDLISKMKIVSSYASLNGLSYKSNSRIALSKDNYDKIARVYGFKESYDQLFAGQENNGSDYYFPIDGCVGPISIKENLTYEVNDNVIKVVNNMTVTNMEDNSKTNKTATYMFNVNEINNDYEFVLIKVTY